MDEGVGRPSTYLECLQFFLAPTDLNGANPDPSKRPNVIGNSYACPPEEGCAVSSLQAAVDSLRAAGVFVAVSAGNEGRGGCSTVAYPPAVYDAAVSVGATDANDQIAPFSSRGPVTADGSGRLKPDLVAPGVGVRSSTPTGYALASGTSMASPHVAGAVLLLWSAFPELRGQVDATEQLLERTAAPLTTTDGCGGDSPTAVPNETFGYGRLDVAAAFRAHEAGLLPEMAVAGVTVAEGDTGRTDARFAVTLTSPTSGTVNVRFATRGGSATPRVDFVPASGVVTFASGETSKTVVVQVVGDRLRESTETFTLVLSSPAGASLEKSQAVGTIRDDDLDRTKPVLSRLVMSVRSGAEAVATVRFRISERARVSCRLERRQGSRLRRVGSISRTASSGRGSLLLPFVLAVGSYRIGCEPRDPAGNTGRTVYARFVVAR